MSIGKEKKLKEKRFLLTVNQRVVGSSPTGGAENQAPYIISAFFIL